MSGDITAAGEALRRGAIVCFPTESTYGLAVDIRDGAALARLAVLKGRDPGSPFGLIAADADAARALAAIWPEAADQLALAHWPGPLTIVAPGPQ